MIGLAIEVHRELGPGLLESVYEEWRSKELSAAGILVEQQVPLAVHYKEWRLALAFRADLIVERQLLVEIKTVERLLPVHEAQVITDLRFSGLRVGLLLNFNNGRSQALRALALILFLRALRDLRVHFLLLPCFLLLASLPNL